MAEAESALPLQAASSRPLDEAALRAALGQLGDNSLALQTLDTSHLDLPTGKFFIILTSAISKARFTAA